MSRTFDIVIFGATGYTGQYVVEEAFKQCKIESLKLAVAGRNQKKLVDILNESAKYTGENEITNLPILIADVNNDESLEAMAKQTKVVLNCVGPYRFFGEQVVKACVKSGTHHFDISGEPQYMETMQLKYNKDAEENKCYVVSACGFDSIPSEMAVKYLADAFNGAINDVEAYLLLEGDKEMKIHTGTWESAIYGIAHKNELSGLRKKLLPQKLPKPKYAPSRRSMVFFSDVVQRWCIPFLGSDKSVVLRSQYQLFNQEAQYRPTYFNPYLSMPSFLVTIGTILWGIMFGIMTSFKCGRNLLIKYPSLFSFGFVSKEGSSRRAIENSKMNCFFVGRGWNHKSEIDSEPPNRKITCNLVGPEAGYVSCSIFLVQAAITAIREADKMPSTGGVMAPMAAFNNTTYISRIQTGGVKFKTVSDEKISN